MVLLNALGFMVVKRWYVFVFLIAFLGIATYHWGLKRTLKFLIFGYFIALASEASSIRNGFPYGLYTYRYAAMPGEIFIFGVPIWDSLSYTFLSYAGWMTALWLRSRWNRFESLNVLQRSWGTLLLGAFLTMILDIVIDPVANQGRLWFLGEVYRYPHGGWYFGVPLSNFAGWFLVSFAILAVFRLTDRLEGVPKSIQSVLLGAGLFWGVFLFNLGVTLYIEYYWLAAASAGWGLAILAASQLRSRNRL